MSGSASGGSSLFASTGRWRAGVATLSQVDRKRLPVMLNRIAKAVGTGSTPFKPAELVQLEGLLGLSGDQLSLVVDTASYIFNQAAYAQSTVPSLREHLDSAGLDGDVASLCTSVWEEERATIIGFLKNQALPTYSLEACPWQLHLHLSQSNLTGIKEPSSIFQLSLKNSDKALLSPNDPPAVEHLHFELDHTQLLSFYQDLERIQEQLDRLASR